MLVCREDGLAKGLLTIATVVKAGELVVTCLVKKALLFLHAFGDVLADAHIVGYAPLVVAHWGNALLRVVKRAVAPPIDEGGPEVFSGIKGCSQGTVESLIVRSGLKHGRRSPPHFIDGVPSDFRKGRVDEGDPCTRIGQHHRVAGGVERTRKQQVLLCSAHDIEISCCTDTKCVSTPSSSRTGEIFQCTT